MADKSGKIFADFTLNRIRRALEREPLSAEQAKVIHSVLSGEEESQRHSIDLRFTISFYIRTYYFVFLAGRDRRRSQYLVEQARLARVPRPLLRLLVIVSLVLLSFVFAITLFVGLYILKTKLNIDLIPGFHLADLFK